MKTEPLDGKISKEMTKKEIDITNMKCDVDGCDGAVSAGMFICGVDIFDENGGRFFINDGEFETVWECEEHGAVSALDGDKKYSKPTELMNMKIICIDDKFFINLDIIKSACDFYLRYKDDVDLLKIEHPEYKEEVRQKFRWFDETRLYQEWLFNLAFKDVFKEVEKK